LLIGVFGFAALAAVILNKAMSLIVVIAALSAMLIGVPWTDVSPHWSVAVNLLAGRLLGAWLGASGATRMRSATLYRVLAVLLVLIASALLVTHLGHLATWALTGGIRVITGVIAGLLIGISMRAGAVTISIFPTPQFRRNRASHRKPTWLGVPIADGQTLSARNHCALYRNASCFGTHVVGCLPVLWFSDRLERVARLCRVTS
jgi:hypothetical protein